MFSLHQKLSLFVGLLAGSASPVAQAAWDDWRVISYAELSPPGLESLRQIGVTGSKLVATRTDAGPSDNQAAVAMAPLLAAGLRPYIENIATDFYAPYHRYQPNKSVTALFDEVRRRYHENPIDRIVRLRQPSLSDAQWMRRIELRLAAHVREYGKYQPLYYSLGDETGIADLAANWDFDLSPEALRSMRVWLRRQYPSLAALNLQWGTKFVEWSEVVPPTTETTIARSDKNYSAWSDGKAWMDVAFADAIHQGTNAVHKADPVALAGLEGAQTPGWGGYDYTKLADAVDVLEAYDSHNNIEIVKSLNPALVVLTTSFAAGPLEFHRIWHEVLLGGGGIILWDEKHGFAAEDGSLGPRGQEMAPLFAELTGGLGAQLLASQPVRDKVAILYSPASFRLSWLADRQTDGRDWTLRDSEAEDAETPFRAVTRRAAAQLYHAGIQPQWLGPDMVADGELRRRGIRVLVLPHVLALSSRETSELRRFVNGGGTLLADVVPGQFDGHGHIQPVPLAASQVKLMTALQHDDGDAAAFDAAVRAGAGMPGFRLETRDRLAVRDVDIRVFHNGSVTIIALLRDFAPDSAVKDAVLRLRRPMWRSDMRSGGGATYGDSVTLRLERDSPVVLALSDRRLPAPAINGSHMVKAGGRLTISLARLGAASQPVMHVSVTNPVGQIVTRLGGSRRLNHGQMVWNVPDEMAHQPGQWLVTVRDALSGERVLWPLTAEKR